MTGNNRKASLDILLIDMLSSLTLVYKISNFIFIFIQVKLFLHGLQVMENRKRKARRAKTLLKNGLTSHSSCLCASFSSDNQPTNSGADLEEDDSH